VILTNQNAALAVYTTNAMNENQWDSGFAEAVVRRLANPLGMAMAGRPDFARELLEESERYSQLAEAIDEV
jgi:phage shock protein A